MNESISCSLSVVDLDQNPTYLSLSYTWGDPTIVIPFRLNERPWQVAENLDDALKRLRDASKPLVIFVDALCINQEDLTEKSIQVPMMGRIYSQARVVHCWIGRVDRESTRAPEIFVQIGRGSVDSNASFEEEPLSLVDMKSLTYFLGMPHWKRAWIIQEVVLAPEAVFHYGQHQFLRRDLPDDVEFFHSLHDIWMHLRANSSSLSDLSILDSVIDVYAANMEGFLSATTALRRDRLSKINEADLVELMRQAASVKHDHIYAFLSILDPELRQRILPDYRLEAGLVFRDLAYEYMQVTCDSSLLRYAVGLTDNALGLPSWVPDFSNEHAIEGEPSCFDLNEQVRPDFVIDEHGSLGVTAFCFDRITAVRAVFAPGQQLGGLEDNPREAAAMHKEWRKFFDLEIEAESTSSYVGGGTLEEVYWKTMYMDRIALTGTMSGSRWLVQEDLDSLLAWLCQVGQRPDSEMPTAMANIVYGYNHYLANLKFTPVLGTHDVHPHSCHMFKTAQGYIGTTYRSTNPKVDDNVYLIAGSAAPTILRRAQPDPHKKVILRLVTPAYVAGLMLPGILPDEATAELPMIDYDNYVHPHMKIATSWDRIWLQ